MYGNELVRWSQNILTMQCSFAISLFNTVVNYIINLISYKGTGWALNIKLGKIHMAFVQRCMPSLQNVLSTVTANPSQSFGVITQNLLSEQRLFKLRLF